MREGENIKDLKKGDLSREVKRDALLTQSDGKKGN